MKIALLGTGYAGNGEMALPPELTAVMAPGTSAEILPLRVRTESSNPFELMVKGVVYVDAALTAEAQGFDGVFVNTVGDYGIAGMRAGLNIPVVGAGQAGMHMAASLGDRFAIVTIWPRSLNFLYRHLLRDYGFEQRCVAIRHVGTQDEQARIGDDDNYVKQMRRGENTMLDRIVAECKAAVERDGADAVLLGCTCMSPIASKVALRCDFPVVNPLTAGFKQTETMVSLRLSQSAAAYQPAATRSRPAIAGMVNAVRDAGIDVACEVCVVAANAAE